MLQFRGDNRESNSGPPAPKVGIIPLDHYPKCIEYHNTIKYIYNIFILCFLTLKIMIPVINKYCDNGTYVMPPADIIILRVNILIK